MILLRRQRTTTERYDRMKKFLINFMIKKMKAICNLTKIYTKTLFQLKQQLSIFNLQVQNFQKIQNQENIIINFQKNQKIFIISHIYKQLTHYSIFSSQLQQSYKNMQTVALCLGLSQHQLKLIIIAIMALLSLVMLKRKKGNQKSLLSEYKDKEDVINTQKKQLHKTQQDKNRFTCQFKRQSNIQKIFSSKQHLENLTQQNFDNFFHKNLQAYRNTDFKNQLTNNPHQKRIQNHKQNIFSNTLNIIQEQDYFSKNQLPIFQTRYQPQAKSQKYSIFDSANQNEQLNKIKFQKNWNCSQMQRKSSIFESSFNENKNIVSDNLYFNRYDNDYGLHYLDANNEIDRVSLKHQNQEGKGSQNKYSLCNINQTQRQNFVQSKAKLLANQISSNRMSNQDYFRKYCPELFVQKEQQKQVFFDIKMEQQISNQIGNNSILNNQGSYNSIVNSQIVNSSIIDDSNKKYSQEQLQESQQKSHDYSKIQSSNSSFQKSKKHIPEAQKKQSKFDKNLMKRRRAILKTKNNFKHSSKNKFKHDLQKLQWYKKFQILAIEQLYQLIKKKKNISKQKSKKKQQSRKRSKKQKQQ